MNDTPQSEKRKIAIVPCSGIGKTYGTVSREAAYEVVEDICPQMSELVALSMLVLGEQGAREAVAGNQAITIDGAFSEAYGDRGYTLILDPKGTHLAEHHHFESIEEALTRGADIIPTMQEIQQFAQPRHVGETESGEAIRHEIAVLKRLVAAYHAHVM